MSNSQTAADASTSDGNVEPQQKVAEESTKTATTSGNTKDTNGSTSNGQVNQQILVFLIHLCFGVHLFAIPHANE